VQGDPDVLRLLNEQLTSELTSINQYFLHSKMQDNWGLSEVAKHTRKESFEEMQHAEEITDRILLLDGPAQLSAIVLPAGRADPR
jgi:bacterioferritin